MPHLGVPDEGMGWASVARGQSQVRENPTTTPPHAQPQHRRMHTSSSAPSSSVHGGWLGRLPGRCRAARTLQPCFTRLLSVRPRSCRIKTFLCPILIEHARSTSFACRPRRAPPRLQRRHRQRRRARTARAARVATQARPRRHPSSPHLASPRLSLCRRRWCWATTRATAARFVGFDFVSAARTAPRACSSSGRPRRGAGRSRSPTRRATFPSSTLTTR